MSNVPEEQPVALYLIMGRYGKSDPVPLYVGISKDPHRRFATHLARCHSRELDQRIRCLIEGGGSIEFGVASWYASRREAADREQFWIRTFASEGCPLANSEALPGGKYFRAGN